MKFIFRAILGNIASSLWFFPVVSKTLHKLRGINFKNSNSVFISRGVILDNRYPELIYIDEDVWLTQNVTVLSHSYASNLQVEKYGMHELTAAVKIEKGVFIGVGSIILPGVTLAAGCYIGAGSVVTRNIPAGVIAAGNPCRILRSLN